MSSPLMLIKPGKIGGLFCFVVASLLAFDVVAQYNNEQTSMPKEIADDEMVQFFRTAAVYHADSDSWRIPIHGWVYEPQQSVFRKAIFSQALKTKYQLQVSAAAEPYYQRRLNLLIADNERGKTPVVDIAGQALTVGASAANGHFHGEITLADAVVKQHRNNNVLPFSTGAADGRLFRGEVLLLNYHGRSVISDIDDTVKISEVLNHQQLIENTFLKSFSAVPGMSEAYQRLATEVDGFHFVSSSPWQLYAPLQEFIDAAVFPPATFSLKSIRFRDMTLFDLFKPGTITKPEQIQQLFNRLPGHRFILIGDSGEQDPEVYARFAREFPQRVEKIFIRNITNERIDNPRFKPLVNGNVSKWVLFENPNDIRL